MINGVNTVDTHFTFATSESKNKISTDLPKGRSDLISVFQYAYQPDPTISAKSVSKTKDFTLIQTEPIGLERVHVQRLQTHAQLRNNRWDYQKFYSLNTTTDSVMEQSRATHKTPNKTNNNNNNINNNNIIYTNTNTNISNNNHIENKSAFIKCNKKEEEQQQNNKSIPKTAGMRLEYYKNTQKIKIDESMSSSDSGNGTKTPNLINMGDKFTSDMNTAIAVDGQQMERNIVPNYYRTEDQENAFRRIEDVHNYAKLNRYGNSNESSDASTREYDDEEDEDDVDDGDDDGDEDDDDDDDNDDDDIEENEKEKDRIRRTEMQKHIHRGYQNMTKNVSKPNGLTEGACFPNKLKSFSTAYKKTECNSLPTEDSDAIVDIETVPGENEQQLQLQSSPPAHHARRPMNAFLIFCKRHRAIVKDRYKSLENRAITKILGDWWASLDGDEKDCFTKLAQQNKDAFFSAHPNFKWYKLPAPPLRTLNTRPCNAAERGSEENDYEAEVPRPQNKTQTGSYFKLADEAQMGELNSLINVKSKIECPTQCELQKTLGETTHFLSAHMPMNIGETEFADALKEKSNKKRRAIMDNSFSSNSSEDDIIPRKTSRSCKGKIYQELVSSGQIAPITKKAKTTTKTTSNTMQFSNEFNDTSESHNTIVESNEALNPASYFRVADIRGNSTKRTVSESDVNHRFGDQFGQFDLEEKIKKLPALSLDAYLQRKRNIKKKKKFTTKKRNSNSVSLPITEARSNVSLTPPKEIRNQCTVAAVGSQKRKARKESITRRDISAIENEVASLIPLTSNFSTSNGCYYFNEMSSLTSTILSTPSATTTTTKSPPIATSAAKCTEVDSVSFSPANAANVNDSSRAYSNYVDNITTTSDLFILAEVAAKRTELTN